MGRGNIFGRTSQLLDFTVDGFHPGVLGLLGLALEPHHDAARPLGARLAAARAGRLLVLDVLQLVHLERGLVVGNDVPHSHLADAATESQVMSSSLTHLR